MQAGEQSPVCLGLCAASRTRQQVAKETLGPAISFW